MVFDDDKDTFCNPMIDNTLEICEDHVPWFRDLDKRALTDKEVQLSNNTINLLGCKCRAHLKPRYGYSEKWQA